MPVGIAVDRGHRCQRFELGEQIGRPDVTGMKNVVNLPKNLEHLVPEQAVSVRNDTEPHQRERAATEEVGASFPSRLWKALRSSSLWKLQWPYRSTSVWVKNELVAAAASLL